ncbi:MAG: hypothetical protein WD077_15180 [Bacteroidia bacterium]
METKRIDNEHISIWIEDDIVFVLFRPKVHYDLALARKVVAERLQVTGNRRLCMIGDLTEMDPATKEARAYFSSEEATKNIISGAFITPSKFIEIATNLWLSFNKPAVPVRLFTDKEKAIEWVKSYC